MTHTPASEPFELTTTPPMALASTDTRFASAWAGALPSGEAASNRTIVEKRTKPQAINENFKDGECNRVITSPFGSLGN
jgi:hypothetical protein